MFNLKELLKKRILRMKKLFSFLGLKDPEQCKLLQEEAYRRTTALMGNKVLLPAGSLNVPTSALRIAVTAELGRTIIKYAVMR